MWTQLALALFIVLLFLTTKSDKKKKDIILPIAFLIVTFFFAVRYDYGNDYWHYYERWYSGRLSEGSSDTIRGTGEVFFYWFMHLFDKFYKFVIAHTIIFCSCLFILVRKYVHPRYYALFFFFFMTMSSLSYNMMSAMRSTMAACVLWIAFDNCYIRKKNWLFFIPLVIVAAFFHSSAIVFVIMPLLDLLLNKANPRLLFVFMSVGMVVNVFFAKELYSFMINLSPFLQDTYGGYLDLEKTGGATILGALNQSVLLFPFYFISNKKEYLSNDIRKTRIWIIAMVILLLKCYGLDLDGRFSLILFIFAIFVLTYVLPYLKRDEKIICLVPLFIYWAYNRVYLFYQMNLRYEYTDLNAGDGSFLFYHWLFNAPMLP